MKINKVKLNPFGAITDRDFTLEEDLNVLLGPNEAGKSTLINAIFAALFFSSAVRKNSDDWKGFLEHYLPHPEGDTIRVELDLIAENGVKAKYLCAWGAGGEECLTLQVAAKLTISLLSASSSASCCNLAGAPTTPFCSPGRKK